MITNVTTRLLIPAFAAVLLFLAPASYAQITIDRAYADERLEGRFLIRTFETFDDSALQDVLEAAAQNGSYDFSAIEYDLVSEEVIEGFVLPADIPGADEPEFAEATHALQLTFELDEDEVAATAFGFFRVDDSGLHHIGIYAEMEDEGEIVPVKLINQPPRREFVFPLTMGTSWEETITESMIFGDEVVNETDNDYSSEVTGYGTLTVPGGGSAAALRIHVTSTFSLFGFEFEMRQVEFITRDSISATIFLDDEGNAEGGEYVIFRPLAPTSVQPIVGLPDGYRLEQNYPNPFNPSTSIVYEVPETHHVTITVFDALGRVVDTLVDGTVPAGLHHVSFHANGLPSGIYMYRMSAGAASATGRMVLLK